MLRVKGLVIELIKTHLQELERKGVSCPTANRRLGIGGPL